MTHGDGGKGDAQRPTNKEAFDKHFDNIFRKTAQMIEEIEEDDEDDTCSWCGGCGEGMYDGATCKKCKGSGIEPVEKDDDV